MELTRKRRLATHSSRGIRTKNPPLPRNLVIPVPALVLAGLASEINTYMDAHPDDVEHFVGLYREVYERVKAEAPDTQIFVTFQ